MTNFKRDMLIGLLFVVGILGFISGEFIVSTIMFGSAALFSNMLLSHRSHN